MTTRNKIPGRAKYGNKKTVVDGISFDSKKEAKRYGELKMMERAGLIARLQTQVTFNLTVNGSLVGKYIADFSYIDAKCFERIVEDVKGFKTPVYNLKKKLMKACYGIEIKET